METEKLFSKYAEKYDLWYDKHEEWFKKEIKLIRDAINYNKSKLQNSRKKEDASLEVGVGTGRFSKELDIYVGVDISLNMLKIAKSRNVEVLLADAGCLPFKSNIFNYIVFAFTICFLEQPFKAIIEAKRVLSELGKLILLIVPSDSKLGKEYMKKDSIFYKNAKFYSIKDAEEIIEKAGMKVIKVDFANLKYGKDVVCITAVKLEGNDLNNNSNK